MPSSIRLNRVPLALLIAVVLSATGWLFGQESSAPDPAPNKSTTYSNEKAVVHSDTPAVYAPDWERPYPQYQPIGKVLMPFPVVTPGEMVAQQLYKYGGAGTRIFASVDDVRDFDDFFRRCSEMKPRVMAERTKYMNLRYDLSGKTSAGRNDDAGQTAPHWPRDAASARRRTLGKSLAASHARGDVGAETLFPEGFRPLSHPLQSTGHHALPADVDATAHPEHERFDVDFDIPDAYLPEFPPPLS